MLKKSSVFAGIIMEKFKSDFENGKEKLDLKGVSEQGCAVILDP